MKISSLILLAGLAFASRSIASTVTLPAAPVVNVPVVVTLPGKNSSTYSFSKTVDEIKASPSSLAGTKLSALPSSQWRGKLVKNLRNNEVGVVISASADEAYWVSAEKGSKNNENIRASLLELI